VCPHCGGAGEHPRKRSKKELKREAGRAKLVARAAELEALLRRHPAVAACLVEPQAPGKLACAHIQLREQLPCAVSAEEAALGTSHAAADVTDADELLLTGIMGWLHCETAPEGAAASAESGRRFFPGGVQVVAQLPPRPSARAATRPWDHCRGCDGGGLVALAGTGAAAAQSIPAMATAAAQEAAPLIAIAGGGIGGAALAVALQQRGMRVVIYERDESFSARRQGYGLTMQQGGTALTKLGLQPEGISSSSHFVFNTAGEILGFFGRALTGGGAEGGGGRGGGGGGGAAEGGGGGGGGGGAAEGGGGGEAPMDIDGQQPPSARNKPPSKDGRKNRQMYNLHVPRQRLRQRLLESLAPGTGQKTETKRNETQRPFCVIFLFNKIILP
jgi:hypothetical protein